MFQEIRKVIIM